MKAWFTFSGCIRMAKPWRNSLGIVVLVFAAATLSGCAGSPDTRSSIDHPSPSVIASVDGAPVFPTNGTAFQIDANARMRGYIESSRATDFCPGPKKWRPDQRCVVTRGWDYSKAETFVRTFDPEGERLDEVVEPGADLSLVPAEQQRVESLLRAEPTLAPVVNRPSVRVWAGGFVFRKPGDPFCDRGSRCVHAIAGANNGEDAIAHAIVDLMTDKVVYPDYKPAGLATNFKHLGN